MFKEKMFNVLKESDINEYYIRCDNDKVILKKDLAIEYFDECIEYIYGMKPINEASMQDIFDALQKVILDNMKYTDLGAKVSKEITLNIVTPNHDILESQTFNIDVYENNNELCTNINTESPIIVMYNDDEYDFFEHNICEYNNGYAYLLNNSFSQEVYENVDIKEVIRLTKEEKEKSNSDEINIQKKNVENDDIVIKKTLTQHFDGFIGKIKTLLHHLFSDDDEDLEHLEELDELFQKK